MWKRALLAVAALVGMVLIVASVILIRAHIGIRSIRPALPSLGMVQAAVATAAGGPVRLSWINTASQVVPRAGVLGAGDPHPERPYRLCHSSFVLEWSDGRTLLIDAGMTREQAESFGGMGELVGGGPIEVKTTVAESLGANVESVEAIVFSHLHVDHVDGVRELCGHGRSSKIAVFMTPEQANHANYLTSGGLETVRSLDCTDPVELPSGGLVPLPGFPGVFVIPAGGHTPGSQIVVAVVDGENGRRAVAFTGDIVNHIDGIEYDIGKPTAYSLLVVPEAVDRLGELRRFLRSLRDRAGFDLLVSHDENSLESSGVSSYQTESSR